MRTLLFSAALLAGPALGAAPYEARTTVKISRGFWEMNGKRTNPGSEAQGLLMNVRMVNCTFEDRNPATCPMGFDPQKNTDAFIAKIPAYKASGVNAFTLCLQGGSPGYEGALNSAYDEKGALRADYLKRVASVIEACDREGLAVILGCFYQEQDQVLKDADAVRSAVRATATWVRDSGYKNVILEIANEHPHAGFKHEIIKDPAGMEELLTIARTTAPDVLASASGMGNGRLDQQVQSAASFILLHFNNTSLAVIQERVANARKISKAIVVNEDDKTGETGAKALEECVNSMASWGYMNAKKNQYHPFTFDGPADDPVVYAKLKELTRAR